MAHDLKSHGTWLKESWHITSKNHGTWLIESWHMTQWVMAHDSMSHGTWFKESWHICICIHVSIYLHAHIYIYVGATGTFRAVPFSPLSAFEAHMCKRHVTRMKKGCVTHYIYIYIYIHTHVLYVYIYSGYTYIYIAATGRLHGMPLPLSLPWKPHIQTSCHTYEIVMSHTLYTYILIHIHVLYTYTYK